MIYTPMLTLLELMSQREDQLKKRLEKEQLLRRQAEEKLRKLENSPDCAVPGENTRKVSRSGPDYEEGPHSQLVKLISDWLTPD